MEGLVHLESEDLILDANGYLATPSRSLVTVDSYGAATSDDLVRINGGSEGDVIILRAYSSARIITVKDGTYIQLDGSTDFSLANVYKRLTLMCSSSNIWVEVSRSNN